METRRRAWNRLRPYLDLNSLRNGVTSAESLTTTKLASAVSQGRYPTDDKSGLSDVVGARTEFDARVSCTVPPAPGNEQAAGISVNVGPLIPQWLANPATGTDYEGRTARPTSAETALPAVVMMAKAVVVSITAAGPIAAESGRPPPRPLPKTTISGSSPSA